MRKANEKEQVFVNLLKACYEHDTYSLPVICSKMGISYEQIMECVKEKEEWAWMLEMCYTLCAYNAEDAGLMRRISSAEAIKYILQNSDYT